MVWTMFLSNRIANKLIKDRTGPLGTIKARVNSLSPCAKNKTTDEESHSCSVELPKQN